MNGTDKIDEITKMDGIDKADEIAGQTANKTCEAGKLAKTDKMTGQTADKVNEIGELCKITEQLVSEASKADKLAKSSGIARQTADGTSEQTACEQASRRERQAYGFLYEDAIVREYGFVPTQDYTAPWDAYYEGVPVSIKTKKAYGAVEMGSTLRQAGVEEDFLLIIGFWVRNNGQKSLQKEMMLKIPGDFWHQQFPERESQLWNPAFVFDGITNERKDDAEWRKRRLELKREWQTVNSIVNLNYKRDHKNQKRIQCSIKKDVFFDLLVPEFSLDSLFDI